MCFVNVPIVVLGQVLFRVGMKNVDVNSILDIAKAMFSPILLMGIALYGFSLFLWLYILSRIPISQAYPIQALAFPLMLIVSKFVLGEDISLVRWIGIVIIFMGVIVITR